MKISGILEIFRQVLDSLFANPLRSMLSALGVVIGITFVILMGWALTSLDLALENTFNIIGVDMLYVDKFNWAGGPRWKIMKPRKDITINQAEEFIRNIKTAQLAIPLARQWSANIKYRNQSFQGLIVMGTNSNYAETPAGAILDGRFFSQAEEQYGDNVVVLGYKVAQTIFPNESPINKVIKINGHKYTTIGVVEKRGVLFVDFIDNQVFIPLKTFFGAYGKTGRSISIAVKAGSEQAMPEVRQESIGLMRAIRNLGPYDEDDFSLNESQSFKSTIDEMNKYVWGIGIGMTGLSFIVGIIGIMNIMFVSVAERTREIGIRKALGAKKIAIWIQFITESTVLCFIGAVISFIICSGLIFLIVTIIPYIYPDLDFLPKLIPASLFITACLVSFAVGILSGLLPAIRAANLDPVEALRFE